MNIYLNDYQYMKINLKFKYMYSNVEVFFLWIMASIFKIWKFYSWINYLLKSDYKNDDFRPSKLLIKYLIEDKMIMLHQYVYKKIFYRAT